METAFRTNISDPRALSNDSLESLASVLTRRWRRFSFWTWTCDSSRHPRAHTASSVNTNTRITRSVQSSTIATSWLPPKEVSLCHVRCITRFCNSKTILNLYSHPLTIMYWHPHTTIMYSLPHTIHYHAFTEMYSHCNLYSHLYDLNGSVLTLIHYLQVGHG